MIYGIIAAPGESQFQTVSAGAGFLSEHHSDFSGAPQNSVTYSAVDIGAEDAGRIIFVAMAGETDDHTTGDPTCTIGGTTATLAAINRADFADVGAIWYASIPTGTTADIVITTAAFNWYTLTAGVYSFNNLISSTPSDTLAIMDDTGHQVISGSIDVPTGGFALIAGGISDAVSVSPTGFTADASVMQTFTHQVIGQLATAGTRTIGLDWTASAENLSAVLVAASWH